jgi:hypothetical protein
MTGTGTPTGGIIGAIAVIATFVIAGYAAYHLGSISDESEVTAVEHTLVVCIGTDGKALFQGTGEVEHVFGEVLKLTEPSGLQRYFRGTTCIVTKGTEVQFAAAQRAAEALVPEAPDAASD